MESEIRNGRFKAFLERHARMPAQQLFSCRDQRLAPPWIVRRQRFELNR
jgi:hypothetical protein